MAALSFQADLKVYMWSMMYGKAMRLLRNVACRRDISSNFLQRTERREDGGREMHDVYDGHLPSGGGKVAASLEVYVSYC